MLSAYLQGVGILGPGIGDWRSAVPLLQGQADYVPAACLLPPPVALPPAERRRAGRVIRLALAVGAEAVTAAAADPAVLPSVFSSSSGDGETCHEICVALAGSERLLSPTRFHNSVHNAASGYWSIAYGCRAPSTSLCAHDGSFGAGLLEALAQLARSRGALLLVSYEVDYPPPVRWTRPIPDAFGIALLLSHDAEGAQWRRAAQASGPQEAPGARTPWAHLRLSVTDTPATEMRAPPLEQLRRQIPAARSLPLLERLASRQSGAVTLDYLDGQRLRIEIEL